MRLRPAALLAVALSLAACGSSSSGGSGGSGGGWFGWLTGDSAPASCPPVSKVGDAAQLVRFAPGSSSQDLNNELFEAGIFDIAGGCSNADNGVKVDMTADFVAARGPANTDNKASFEYFVAVVDDSQNIIAREQFPITIAFPGNQTRNGQREQLQEIVPVGKQQQAAAFHIYVGFVLTRDEVAYNRAHP